MIRFGDLLDHKAETNRYLEAGKVLLPSRAPRFAKEGCCQWCNKPLTGKAKCYCRPTNNSPYYKASECAVYFLSWWCSRPAYARATFIRDNFTCRNCGLHPLRVDKPWLPDISQLECDHIVPIARGGKTEMDNLQTLCKHCNRKKGIRKRVPEEAEQGTLELHSV